jgi:hypothetical protein
MEDEVKHLPSGPGHSHNIIQLNQYPIILNFDHTTFPCYAIGDEYPFPFHHTTWTSARRTRSE